MGFASFSGSCPSCGVAKWAACDKEAGQGPGNKVSVGVATLRTVCKRETINRYRLEMYSTAVSQPCVTRSNQEYPYTSYLVVGIWVVCTAYHSTSDVPLWMPVHASFTLLPFIQKQ